MSYDFSNFKERIREIEGWLDDELKVLRAGRATIAILDGVKVEAYGSKMPINQIANIAIENARTLYISPYDKEQIKNIEKAVNDSRLGLSIASGSDGLRASFPELTSEKRESFVKVLGEKLEEARVSLRRKRDEVWDKIQKEEREGIITEDDKFRFKNEMQKLADEGGKKFEEMAEKKEREIRA